MTRAKANQARTKALCPKPPHRKQMAVPFATACRDQDRPLLRPQVHALSDAMSSGIPIPNQQRQCGGSDMASVSERKGNHSFHSSLTGSRGLINPKDDHVPNPMNPTLSSYSFPNWCSAVRCIGRSPSRQAARVDAIAPSRLVSRSKKSKRTKTGSPRLRPLR